MALTRIDSYLVDLDSLGGVNFDVQSGVPTFKVDAINHRVGVGTASPGRILECKPSASLASLGFETGTINSDSVRLSAGGTTNTYLEYRGYLGHAWFVQETEHLRLNSSGNLGLGVVPSAWASVAGLKAFDISTWTAVAGNSAGSALLFNTYYGNTGYTYKQSAAAGVYELSDSHRWFTAPSGTAGNPITFTQAMTLDASGNLGIGISAPVEKLEVGATSAGYSTGFCIANGNFAAGIAATVDNKTNTWFTGVRKDAVGGSLGTERFSILRGSNNYLTITTGGLVGLGTSSPGERLAVNGNATIGDTSQPVFYLRSTTNSGSSTVLSSIDSYSTPYSATNARIAFRGGYVGYADLGAISFQTKGFDGLNDRVFITSTGLVGIGTTSPGSPLTVESSAGNQFKITYPSIASYYLNVTSAGALDINKDGSSRLFIDSSGRLLVGTSSARTPLTHSPSLQVEGVGYAPSTISVIGNSNDINGSYIFIGKSRGTSVGSNTIVQSGDEIGGLDFIATDGTQALRAARITAHVDGTPGTNDMPGRLLFYTTADGADTPTERMRITNAGRVNMISTEAGIISETTQGSGTTYVTFQGRYGATTGSPLSGVASFQVYSNGNVQNSNNSYGSISDLKLKENIVNATSQWSDIKSLQIRKYNFKEGQTHTQIGLVAQEVELVSPGLVSESPDRDAEGNDLGTVTKSVNYSVLYMKAVKALQEAMERIEKLEADVAALKA